MSPTPFCHELAQRGVGRGGCSDVGRLRHREPYPGWKRTSPLQDKSKATDEIRERELRCREIYRDWDTGAATMVDPRRKLRGFGQNELGNVEDHAGLFGQLAQAYRLLDAEQRVVPPRQRLGSDDQPTGELHFRLVVHHEIAVLDGLPQLSRQPPPLGELGFDLLVELLRRATHPSARLAQGDRGLLHGRSCQATAGCDRVAHADRGVAGESRQGNASANGFQDARRPGLRSRPESRATLWRTGPIRGGRAAPLAARPTAGAQTPGAKHRRGPNPRRC